MNTNSVRFFNSRAVPRLPEGCELILAAWQIRNPGNMGQIIRLGHNAGAKRVVFIRDTGNIRHSKIKKTAGFSYDQMDWAIISGEAFSSMMNSHRELVLLETFEGAENLFREPLPPKAIILAGNESQGLPPEILGKTNRRYYIPMPGGCKSMNVSQALTVASFEWVRQHLAE